MSDFQSTSIAELASVRSGGAAPQDEASFSDEGDPFVRAGSLSGLLNGRSEDDLEKISPQSARAHRLQLFPEGTVLFAKSGMSATKGYIYRLKRPSYVVSHLAALVPHDPRDGDFLVRALQRFSPTSLIKDPAYPSIRLGDIEEMKIAAPRSVSARSRIASMLNKADALRRIRRESIRHMEELRASYFFNAFGDPISNDRDWPIMRLGQALEAGYIREIQDGNHGERHPKVKDFVETGIPFITANCLRDDILNVRAAYKLDEIWMSKLRIGFCQPGDVLLSHKGTVGELAIVPQDVPRAILSPQVTYYRLGTGLDARFLLATFRTESFQKLLAKAAEQSTRAYIGITRQRELPIIIPPFALQAEFAAVAVCIENSLSQQRMHLAELDRLFDSLQHKAFSGSL